MESEEERVKNSVHRLLGLISRWHKDARPYVSELEGFKLTREQYRFGLVELICSEEHENPDPGSNWHKADLEDLFDNELEMQKVQEETEKEAERSEQQETEVKRREISESEGTEAQDIRYHVSKYLNTAVVAYKVLPTKQAIEMMTMRARATELNHCLGNNELFKFLNKPLPSWLKYFGITKNEYQLETEEVEFTRPSQWTNIGQIVANSQLLAENLSLSNQTLQIPLQPMVSSSSLFQKPFVKTHPKVTVHQKRIVQDCPQEALDTTMGQQLQEVLQRRKDEMQLEVDVLAQERQC